MPRDWGPNVRFPPPLLFIAGFLIGVYLLDTPSRPIRLFAGGAPQWAQIAGAVAVVLGVALTFSGFVWLRRALTPVVTISPATSLVTGGPYTFSRNPMYVGMSIAYLGLAVALNAGGALVVFPLVLVTLFVLVIRKEERHLGEKFGESYGAYRQRVRRWL